MGSDMWIQHNNVESMGQVKSITTDHTKGQSSCKEGYVGIWWDWKGVLYYQFLPEN